MVYLLGFPVHVATATSHFVLAVSALAGVISHVLIPSCKNPKFGYSELITEGPVYAHYAKLTEDTFHGVYSAKCAVIVTPERLIVASPNAQNKEELPL